MAIKLGGSIKENEDTKPIKYNMGGGFGRNWDDYDQNTMYEHPIYELYVKKEYFLSEAT